MQKELYSPGNEDTTVGVTRIINGGTGESTAIAALAALNGIPANTINQPNGILGLDGDMKVSSLGLEESVRVGVSLIGNTELIINEVTNFTITDYDVFKTYTLEAISGSVYRIGNTVTYTAPNSVVPAGFTINGRIVNITVIQPIPNTPDITSPLNNAIDQNPYVSLTSSAFTMNAGTDIHQYTDWQIATDIGFTSIVSSSITDAVNKTSWISGKLVENTTYYTRVRYKGVDYGYTPWSNIITFTTKVQFVPLLEEAKLSASDKAAGDFFSVSVSMDGTGTRVIVGAYNADTPVSLGDAGASYIFVRSGTTWSQEAKLIASDTAVSDHFGISVSISNDGSRVIVGAYSAEAAGISGAGKAYVFLRTGTSWTEEAILTASDKAIGDNFGYSVAMAADSIRVVIGAFNADPGTLSDSGTVYIFTRSGTVWTEEQILTASDKAISDNFGKVVAIDQTGTRVVIGSPGADPDVLSAAGKAYVFSRFSTTWTEEQILTASDKAAGDNFGYSVAISATGNRVAIGAYLADPDAILGSGKVYIFSRSGTVWTEEQILTTSVKNSNTYLGWSVSLNGDGDKLIAGAMNSSPDSVTASGAIHNYYRINTVWTEESKVIASDKGTNDNFGYSVSISSDGSRSIIGSYSNDAGGTSNAGAAYIFS